MEITAQEFDAKCKAFPPIDRETALKSVNWKPYWDFRRKQDCIGRAMARPLPGAAGTAFTRGQLQAGEKVISRVSPAIWTLLQAVESPILQMFEEAIATGESKFEWKEEQKWDACWIFTEDVRRLSSLMDLKGGKAVSDEARAAVRFDWDESQIEIVMAAILEQVFRHAETKVKYLKEAAERGDVRFFREQAAQPQATAASGGS